MSRALNLVVTILLGSLLIISCGQVSKQVAKNNLTGQYTGQVTYYYRYSQINPGVEDQSKNQPCSASVVADSKSPVILVDGYNLKIAGFKLLANGASFNILPQVITDGAYSLSANGNPIFTDSDGSKSDGYMNDNGNLTFSYTATIPVNQEGVAYNIPIEAEFVLRKISN